MSVNIYSLRNPITNEIIYVGKTIYALNYRLNHHYTKLRECQKGKRNYTPLFKYLENLLPTKVTIELIEEVEDSEQNYKERYYINEYKNKYNTLLNDTFRGDGGNTYILKSESELKAIGNKISKKLKGKAKPKGFKEHLSAIRKGKNNPSAKKLNNPIIAIKDNVIIKRFYYLYEINLFLNDKYSASNIIRALIDKTHCNCKGYSFKYEINN